MNILPVPSVTKREGKGKKHHYLEAIETMCFRGLDLIAKALNQVLIDYAIQGSEEGVYIQDNQPC